MRPPRPFFAGTTVSRHGVALTSMTLGGPSCENEELRKPCKKGPLGVKTQVLCLSEAKRRFQRSFRYFFSSRKKAAPKLSRPLCAQRLSAVGATCPRAHLGAGSTGLAGSRGLTVFSSCCCSAGSGGFTGPQAFRLPREGLTKARCLSGSGSASDALASHSGCSVTLHASSVAAGGVSLGGWKVGLFGCLTRRRVRTVRALRRLDHAVPIRVMTLVEVPKSTTYNGDSVEAPNSCTKGKWHSTITARSAVLAVDMSPAPVAGTYVRSAGTLHDQRQVSLFIQA